MLFLYLFLTFSISFCMVWTHFNNIMKVTGPFKHCHSSNIRRTYQGFRVGFELKWTVWTNIGVQFARLCRICPCGRLGGRFSGWTKRNFKVMVSSELLRCWHCGKLGTVVHILVHWGEWRTHLAIVSWML